MGVSDGSPEEASGPEEAAARGSCGVGNSVVALPIQRLNKGRRFTTDMRIA